MKPNFNIRYVFTGSTMKKSHMFVITEDDGLTSRSSFWTIGEILQRPELNYLLEPALDCCDFIPKELNIREKLAFLQLTETTNEL